MKTARQDVARVGVLFVCMGNICRSPTAEGVFRHMVMAAGLEQQIRIDSAGTHDYHIGAPPDARAQAAAARRGYDLSGLVARQIRASDMMDFDYVLAMDSRNMLHLRQLALPGQRASLQLFMECSVSRAHTEVPDPYYGGVHGFDLVLDLVEAAAAGLLVHLKEKKLGP